MVAFDATVEAGPEKNDGVRWIGATRRSCHLATQHAAAGVGRSPRWVNRNPLHAGEINHHAIRTSPAQVTVPAGARRHFQFMTLRKLHRSQHILLGRALHDDPRPPLRSCVPVKDAPRAFIGGIGGENQTSFEFGAQPVDLRATEVISVGYRKMLTAGGEPKCPRSGDRSFDEVASGVGAHLYDVSSLRGERDSGESILARLGCF
jgi:hypothetical protein